MSSLWDYLLQAILSYVPLTVALITIPFAYQYIRELRARKSLEQEVNRLKSLAEFSEPASTRTYGKPVVPSVPRGLAVVCAEGECVLFAGSKLGALAGLPTLRDVLARIVEREEDAGAERDWDTVRLALQTGDLIAAAELISNRVPRSRVLQTVRDLYEQRVAGIPPTYRSLQRIPFAAILTTAWDNLLEQAFLDRKPVVLTTSDAPTFAQLLRQNEFIILKLYGDLKNVESFSLFSDEFRQGILRKEPRLLEFLNSICRSKTILFLGATLQEVRDFLTNFTIEGSDRRHFALVEDQADIEMQKRRFLSRYNVQLMSYRPSRGSPEVSEFIEKLAFEVQAKFTETKPRVKMRPATLDELSLENIGPFEKLQLNLNRSWNVILGNNGCGKSTLLRAIALGLCGNDDRARSAAVQLLRSGAQRGSIELVVGGAKYRTELLREGNEVRVRSDRLTPLQTGTWLVLGFPALRGVTIQDPRGPTGDTPRNPNADDVLPLVGGVLDTRLDSLKQWLVNVLLRSEAGEGISRSQARTYAKLRSAFFDLLNELTPGIKLEFSRVDRKSWQVMVETIDGTVPIDLVSLGTSAIMSWIGTWLQRVYEIYPSSENPTMEPALVMIDEIDAHMHPEWQYHLAPKLKQLFPNLQVVATTHSPLIVGNLESNEVFRLSREQTNHHLILEKMPESFEGWRADQILTGPAFGLDTTIGQRTVKLIDEYSSLLGKTKRSPQEDDRVRTLESKLEKSIPLHPETEEERDIVRMMEQWMLQRLQAVPEERRRKMLKEIERYLPQIGTEKGTG